MKRDKIKDEEGDAEIKAHSQRRKRGLEILCLVLASIISFGCSDGKEHIRLYNQAYDYEVTGEYQKSIELLSKAIEIKHDDLKFYNNGAWDYIELGKKDLAVKDFYSILKYDTSNTAALYGLGYINYLDNNYSNAIALFDRIVKIKNAQISLKFVGRETPLEADIKQVYRYKNLAEEKLNKR